MNYHLKLISEHIENDMDYLIEEDEKSGKKNKHHKEDKCERCIELGSYCKNGSRITQDNHNILSNKVSTADDQELAESIAISDIVERSLEVGNGIGDRLEQFQVERILELTTVMEKQT